MAPGSFAPSFQADLVSGKLDQSLIKKNLVDYRGKVILLNFWASWCAPCIVELEALQKLHTEYQQQGFTVLAVALDDTLSAVTQVIKDQGLTFPVLLDNSGRIKSSYQITGFPETLLLDRSGKVTMINDPNAGLVNKIRGERDWYSDYYRGVILSLLKQK